MLQLKTCRLAFVYKGENFSQELNPYIILGGKDGRLDFLTVFILLGRIDDTCKKKYHRKTYFCVGVVTKLDRHIEKMRKDAKSA